MSNNSIQSLLKQRDEIEATISALDSTALINHELNKLELESIEEKMYSKEEVIKLCLKIQQEYTNYRKHSYFTPNMKEIAEWTDNWIEENIN